MSFGKAVLAAFIGGILAGLFLLAYRASKETQKGLLESFGDVPAEAKKVYVDMQAKATGAVNRARGGAAEPEAEDMGDWPETGYVTGGTTES
jgi:hypothetical protein